MIIQSSDQPIDVAYWRQDEEFAPFPEGARDKTLIYCPIPSPYAFLKTTHRYLFKLSASRYPEQFWAEIIAYRLGIQMDIEVPPTFVSYDSIKKQSGALIEWFLRPTNFPYHNEYYIPGGDFCQVFIPKFDRKKGKEHNFETVSKIFDELQSGPHFNEDWKEYWAKTFLFDALIGNTDRHQDNWGIIVQHDFKPNPEIETRISPVFDNGTSMGHEISSSKFEYYCDSNNLMKYISNGLHHMKWNIDGPKIGHLEKLQKLIEHYPKTRQVILHCLKKVNYETFKSILDDLVAFKIPTRLSTERAAFMLRLLQFRHQRLLVELER